MGFGEGFEVPAESAPWSDFHWFAVSPREVLNLVILSSRPMWYTGHFYSGRMEPCLGQRCDRCAEGVGAQVRYCFGVAETSTKRIGLVEMGRGNGLLLQDWSFVQGGLRGMLIEMSKQSKASQSRTEIKLVERPVPLWIDGLEGPDVGLALFLTWEKARFRVPQEMVERYSRIHSPGRIR